MWFLAYSLYSGYAEYNLPVVDREPLDFRYLFGISSGDMAPERITRRVVDSWLLELLHMIRSIVNGPAGDLKARLALVERKIEGWRERLGIR